MKYINKILKDLRIIYPVSLILLSTIPLLVGAFIDYDLVDSREFVIHLAWIPLFSITSFYLRKRFILQFANLIYFIVGFIEISHWVILKGPISVTSILVISNTNTQEAFDFFDLKATYGLLILIPFTIVYILSVRQKNKPLNSQLNPYVVLAIILFAVAFITENTVNGRLVRKGIPHFAQVSISFYEKFNLYREARKETKVKRVEAKLPDMDKSQTFVLILGESCNRNHMSLYGYSKKTTPKLANRKDLIVFDNVVSPYSNTLSSVLTILSESNLENNIEITKGIDIIDMFSAAGFKTYWLSNQSPIGIWDNLVTVFGNKSDSKKFVNLSSNSSFEATYTPSYDAKLFEPFAKALQEKYKRKFIIIHLMGNHSSYSKRYPSEFDVFYGNDHKSNTIAEYDNAIIYNDFVVDSLLKILQLNNSTNNDMLSSAIYLSDHGENVYDELDRVGHDYSKILPKSNVEIPFIVWLSKSYRKEFEDKSTIIESNIHKPFVSDDLFHAILDLNNINSPILDKQRSIFSKMFNDKRKRFLEDKNDYDVD